MHADVTGIIGAHSRPDPNSIIGAHRIACRVCDMERDVFPIGFIDQYPNGESLRGFLHQHLRLPRDADDYEAAARDTYLNMPEFERQMFRHAWEKFRTK